MKEQKRLGFTLVELIVVIAIIFILTAIGFIVYSGVNQRARDAARLADLNELNQAVSIATHDSDNLSLILCSEGTTPCSGSSYPESTDTRNTDGGGWVKVDFDSNMTVTFNILPIDPLNNSTNNYNYCSDGANWKFSAVLEYMSNQNLMTSDGGSDPNRYEVGSRLKGLSC